MRLGKECFPVITPLAEDLGGIIDIRHCSIEILEKAIRDISNEPMPTPSELAEGIENTIEEKHDWVLSEELRGLSYGSKHFDMMGAWACLQDLGLKLTSISRGETASVAR